MKHLSGEIYAEVKVSVSGFHGDFFLGNHLRKWRFCWENMGQSFIPGDSNPREMGKIRRILAEQSTYIQQQLYVSHDLGRNGSECGEFRCMILAGGDCLRCWEIFCGEPHSSSKMVIFDRGTPKFEKDP